MKLLADIVQIGIGIAALIFLPGCSALDGYERSYSVEYQGAKAGVTLKPRGYAK